jgi:putative tryptophan/tyrosine transport system substrate-binding protein
MVPSLSKLGLLALRIQYNGLVKGSPIPEAAQEAGLSIAVSLLDVGAQDNDWRAAVESLSREGANAVMVVDSPETFQNGALIAKLLTDARLPAISTFAESVEAGGLMAYSFDLVELYMRVANNIDAIFRGARAGDIPFYQVTKFDLSINLKTARQLGLTVPTSLSARADKIIE